MRKSGSSSDPQIGVHQLARIDADWQSFVTQKPVGPNIRPLVLRSWERCKEKGLDAFTNRTILTVPSEQVDDYTQNDSLFTELQTLLPSLRDSALDSRHLLVCCDANGNVMYIDGDRSVQRKAEAMNFVVGSGWSEDKAGTNAIGTARATGEPVQIFASEHYAYEVHPWTCSAAPIRDPATQKILGVLNLTGLREFFHPHTLAVVVTATKWIEERLQRKLEVDRFLLLEEYVEANLRSRNTPIATVDVGMRVVKASNDLYEAGWIDRQGRLIGCPIDQLALPTESGWHAEGRNGRWSFLLNPCSHQGRIIGAVVHATRAGTMHAHRSNAERSLLHSFDNLIGQSQPLQAALDIGRTAGSRLPVLIDGETGTGKELLAKAIHSASSRRNGPFVAVNCAALPKDLAITEFLGFDGGTFTGAARDGRPGKLEQASGGTIFLDEIGDLPLELQGILLRSLEEKEVVHIGGRKTIPVDIRVIAATNQDLNAAVERGAFRRDLYYRLKVIEIHLPALRERQEDIELLFDFHLRRACNDVGRSVPKIDADVVRTMENYAWPGNVRELRNIAERLAENHRSDTIQKWNLPPELLRSHAPFADKKKESFAPRDQSIREKEFEMMCSMLEECSGNVTEAARKLGLNRTTIYRKLRRHKSSTDSD